MSDTRPEDSKETAQSAEAATPEKTEEKKEKSVAKGQQAPRGASVMWAAWREGLKDIQQAALDPWNGSRRSHGEPGSIANPTPQMVTQQIQGQSFQDMLAEYAQRGRPSPEREQQADISR